MSPTKRPRVLIADDHFFVAEACARILEPELEVAGIFADGQSLLEAVPELKPDVIILDVGMPLMNGLEAFAGLRSKSFEQRAPTRLQQ